MRSKILECRALLSSLLQQSDRPTEDMCREGESLFSPVAALAIEGNFVLPPEDKITMVRNDDNNTDDDLAALAAAGSFDWTHHADVDVVYACATCFAEDVMMPLTEVHPLTHPHRSMNRLTHLFDSQHDVRVSPSYVPVHASY